MVIFDFGGYLIKVDFENCLGLFIYNWDYVDGVNMLVEVFCLFGGLVIWCCFVYNCK